MRNKPKLAHRLAERMGDLFEMPSSPVQSGTSVTLTDGREAYITGCRELLVYNSDRIKVKSASGTLTVTGEGLDIPRYTDTELTVRGLLNSVSLEREER